MLPIILRARANRGVAKSVMEQAYVRGVVSETAPTGPSSSGTVPGAEDRVTQVLRVRRHCSIQERATLSITARRCLKT
jgi:hypothetical protein